MMMIGYGKNFAKAHHSLQMRTGVFHILYVCAFEIYLRVGNTQFFYGITITRRQDPYVLLFIET